MGNLSLYNHYLQLFPVDHLLCKAFLFFSLSLLVLEEEDADEEVKEEETANEDENDKED